MNAADDGVGDKGGGTGVGVKWVRFWAGARVNPNPQPLRLPPYNAHVHIYIVRLEVLPTPGIHGLCLDPFPCLSLHDSKGWFLVGSPSYRV